MASFKLSSCSMKRTGNWTASVHSVCSDVLAGILGDLGEGVHLVGVQGLDSFSGIKASKVCLVLSRWSKG